MNINKINTALSPVSQNNFSKTNKRNFQNLNINHCDSVSFKAKEDELTAEENLKKAKELLIHAQCFINRRLEEAENTASRLNINKNSAERDVPDFFRIFRKFDSPEKIILLLLQLKNKYAASEILQQNVSDNFIDIGIKNPQSQAGIVFTFDKNNKVIRAAKEIREDGTLKSETSVDSIFNVYRTQYDASGIMPRQVVKYFLGKVVEFTDYSQDLTTNITYDEKNETVKKINLSKQNKSLKQIINVEYSSLNSKLSEIKIKNEGESGKKIFERRNIEMNNAYKILYNSNDESYEYFFGKDKKLEAIYIYKQNNLEYEFYFDKDGNLV